MRNFSRISAIYFTITEEKDERVFATFSLNPFCIRGRCAGTEKYGSCLPFLSIRGGGGGGLARRYEFQKLNKPFRAFALALFLSLFYSLVRETARRGRVAHRGRSYELSTHINILLLETFVTRGVRTAARSLPSRHCARKLKGVPRGFRFGAANLVAGRPRVFPRSPFPSFSSPSPSPLLEKRGIFYFCRTPTCKHRHSVRALPRKPLFYLPLSVSFCVSLFCSYPADRCPPYLNYPFAEPIRRSLSDISRIYPRERS